MSMTSRERVLAALACGQPDRVPYCELAIDRALAQRLMGWGEPQTQAASLEAQPYTLEEAHAVADALQLDNICYVLRPPVYADKLPGQDGRLFYGEGQIRTLADVERMELPDPDDEALYAEAERFVAGKGQRALWLVTRLGIFGTMLSLGMERFSVALYEDRALVERLLDRYTEWTIAVAQRVCRLGFDVYASTDDMAFNTAPFFSPRIWREVVLPRYRRVAPYITLPWVIHSDGNILPFVDDLLALGVAGLHPNEKGAVDIVQMKREYAGRACLLGNVDLVLLGLGTPEEVDAEVRGLIRDVGPGGGYIVTSGNSLPGYLKVENARALSAAVQRYGQYPLQV